MSNKWLVLFVTLLIGWPCSFALADKPAGMSAQTIKLPSGPTSLKGLGESFSTDVATGSGSFSVPIDLPPSILKPALSLSYAAGRGKGVAGMSWDLPVLQVYRTTDKGSPKFVEGDRFAVSGPGLNDELVRVDAATGTYRLKNEGAYALFVRNAAADTWAIRMPNGETLYLGESAQARESATLGSYRWMIERQADRFGHEVRYTYLKDQGRLYLSKVAYQLHAATAYQNTVSLGYEGRTDQYADYSYGQKVVTAQRLRTITVAHGPRVLRTYQLAYRNSLIFSLLTSVQMTGEGGLAMPSLSFDYLEPNLNAGRYVETVSPPPLEGLSNGSAQLEDVNRDGLPDLLVGTAGNYRYYENLDGVSWRPSPISLNGSPDKNLYDASVVLADFDGDGDRDVGFTQPGEGYRYYPADLVWHGTFQGYGAAVSVPTSDPGFDLTSPQVKLSDLNSDGRVDLIWQKPGQDAQLTNLNDTFQSSYITELPFDVNFLDARVELRDFNGDGVLDFVRKEIGWNPSRIRVWFGLGQGAYAAEQQMGNVPTGDPSEFYLEDVNRDGQTDLIRVSGSYATYFLNDGKLQFTSARGDFRGLPSMGNTSKLLFADMNGNGTTDIVWVTRPEAKLIYLDLVGEPFFGFISRVDNGMGAVTDIAYRSSTSYAVEAKRKGQPWLVTLQTPVPVISEVVSSDSIGPETRTTYSYGEGYYDGPEREFRGFGAVITTEHGDDTHETLVTEQRLHVGRNLTSLADEEALKGKPYLALLKNTQGQTYQSVETTWEQRWLCQETSGASQVILPTCSSYPNRAASKDSLVTVAVSTKSLTGAWEKTTNPRYSATLTEYDAWANAVRVRSYGEVTFPSARTLGAGVDLSQANTAFGNDEVINETDLIYDVPDWMIGVPYQNRTLSTGGTILSHTRTYFDGPKYVGLALGQVDKGLVSREESLLSPGNRWIPSVRSEYNEDGLLKSRQDANANLTDLAYDTATRTFATLERHYVEAGNLDFTATYDTAYGAVLQSKDANGKTTSYTYDGLGRADKVIDPIGGLAVPPMPAVDYDYESPVLDSRGLYRFARPVVRTTIKTLVERAGAGSYRFSYQYTDGLGRARLTKTQAEAGFGYIASGYAQFTARGAANRVYDNFPSQNTDFQAPPLDTPVVTRALDALSRATDAYLPATQNMASGFVRTTYVPFGSQEFDERDTNETSWHYGTVTSVDGQGRVVQVEKKNDQAGTVKTLQWKADYDPLGRIVAFKDPAWTENATSPTRDARSMRVYTYDTLSRLTELTDPNLGRVRYTYDDTGNLLTRTDALDQQEGWEYGLGNRVAIRSFKRHVSNTLDCRATPNPASGDYCYLYHYDAPAPSSPLPSASHLLGQLAWVEYPSGREHYSFDELGRQNDELVELWNPATSSFAQQTRDAFRRTATFNADGKVTSVSLPDERDRERATRVVNADGTVTWVPPLGSFVVTNQYNPRGLLSGMTAGPLGNVRTVLSNITYDARGLTTRTDHGNGTRSCSEYDTRGLLTGVITGKSSDVSCGDLQNTDAKGFQNQRYIRTFNGNIGQIKDYSAEIKDTAGNLTVPRLNATYQYDRLNQLVAATDSQGAFRFGYDSIQNLISRAEGTQPATNFAYGERGAGPNMVTTTGSRTFEYDAAGRMKSYNGYALTYDVEGRLSTATKGTTVLRYHYDLWGQRRLALVQRGATMEVTRFIFDEYEQRNGDEVWLVGGSATQVEIAKSKGVVIDDQLFLLYQLRDYASGAALNPKPLPAEYMDFTGDGRFDMADYDIANTAYGSPQRERLGGEKLIWRYYHHDQLTGTTHATDSAGDLVNQTVFDVYGKALQSKGLAPLRGFAGATLEPERDLGLIRFGARYYAPDLGRWITGDRFIGESPVQAWSTLLEANLYSYAANNPIGRRDPGGMWSFREAALWIDEKVGTANIERAGVIAAGAAQVAGGALEMVGGAAGILAPVPVVAQVAGGVMIFHGADTMSAGIMTITTGEHNRTVTAQAATATAKAAGASDQTASAVGDGFDTAVGFGASLTVGVGLMRAAAPAAGCSGACVLGKTCFVEGTSVELASREGAIESVAVGERVRTLNEEVCDHAAKQFVRLELTLRGDMSGRAVLLRSAAWVREAGLVVGSIFELDDPEIGSASAEVIGRRWVQVPAGEGCLVTGTVRHPADQLLTLLLATGESITTTPAHPFFVEEAFGFVVAGELAPGVHFRRGSGGKVELLEIRRDAARQEVYNLEVEGAHTYLVGDSGIWVHNQCTPAGGLKQGLRKQLAKIEELAATPGDSGIRKTMSARETRKLADEFLGPGASTVRRGKQGEMWKQSADGRRLVRMPTDKASPQARTGKQANFHERKSSRDGWFDKQTTSDVHVNVKN